MSKDAFSNDGDAQHVEKPVMVCELIDEFIRSGWLAEQPEAERPSLLRKLSLCKVWLGESNADTVSDIQIEDALSKIELINTDQYKLVQFVLIALFDYALDRGHRSAENDNPARKLLPAEMVTFTHVSYPPKLSVSLFGAMVELADDWLKDLLILMVKTGLRHSEVCSLQFEHIKDGSLFYPPSSDNIGSKCVAVEYILSEDLKSIIKAARKRPPLSPFIISRVNSQRSMTAEKRVHRTQVLPGQVKRYFNLLVNQLKQSRPDVFKGQALPTLDSVRELCRSLYAAVDSSDVETRARLGDFDVDVAMDFLEDNESPYFSVHTELDLSGGESL